MPKTPLLIGDEPVSPASTAPARTRGVSVPGLVAAALLLAASGLIGWDAYGITTAAGYGLGPTAMPALIAGGLGLLGIANLVLAFRGQPANPESADLRAIALILGALAVLIASIALGTGFVLGTTLLFAMTAAAFGRRAFLADLAIGFVLAVAIYLLFTKLLTLSLPVGPLERLL